MTYKIVWLNLMKRPWSGKAIRKVSTSQIGGPSNFRHLVHMTSDLLNDFRPEVDDQLLSGTFHSSSHLELTHKFRSENIPH
jgi:hypothetical protein